MEFLKSLRPGSSQRAWTLAAGAVLTAGLWIIPACSAQTGADGAEDSNVLATIGDKAVTRAEVEAEATEGLKQAEMQKLQCESNFKRSVHQVLEQTLQTVVRDRLLDEEAESRGMTRDELMAAEVESKIAEVSEEEVDKFYTANQARINQPKERVAPQIKQHLASQQQETAFETFITGLEAKNDVTYKMGPYRIDVEASGYAKGPKSAPVTIVEFSDFQCPYCSRVVPTMDKVKEEYGDKVQLVFRHFPLNFHQEAQKASEASLCAGDQDKFWEMHDLLFEEQSSLKVADLKDKAKRLELDEAKFSECLDSGKHADQVATDMQAGVVAGVSGTPAMFINGRFLSGAQPYENIAAIIDEELKADTAN